MRISYENPALGSGGFGRVYKAYILSDWEGSRAIALKKIRTSDYVEYPGLLHEACGLVIAKDHPSIPQVFGWGRSQFYEYLAMELLDCNLLAWFNYHALTRRNFVALVLQMFSAVKHVHASGILHCDIKPENFMFGLGENAGRVYLIDFNLWTAWRSFDTPEHLTDDEEGTAAEGFRGTYRYASINCHLDGALSRRDDLESLAYSIFALYAGGLPWSGRKDCKEILQSKQIWQQWGGLQGTCEYPLGDLVYYAQRLGFTEEPDYDSWRAAFWRVDNGDTADFPLSESDPLYDPADTATEKVPRNMDFVDWEGLQDKFFTVYYPATKNAGRMEYAAGSSHGYFPASSGWDFPLTMKPEDTIDGGQDLIRDFVQHISQPPTTEHPSLSSTCPPEIMRGFDDPIPYKIYIEEENEGVEPEVESEDKSGGETVEDAGEKEDTEPGRGACVEGDEAESCQEGKQSE